MKEKKLEDLPIAGGFFKRSAITSLVIHGIFIIILVVLSKISLEYVQKLKEEKKEEIAQKQQAVEEEAFAEHQLANDVKELLKEIYPNIEEEELKDVAEKILEEIDDEKLKKEINDIFEKEQDDIATEEDHEEYLKHLLEELEKVRDNAIAENDDDMLEQQLLDELLYEDLPNIDNQLDNALKIESLQEIALRALLESGMTVAKQANSDFAKARRESTRLEDKQQYEYTTKKINELKSETRKLIMAVTKRNQKASVKSAENIIELAKAAEENLKMLDPYAATTAQDEKNSNNTITPTYEELLKTTEAKIKQQTKNITELETTLDTSLKQANTAIAKKKATEPQDIAANKAISKAIRNELAADKKLKSTEASSVKVLDRTSSVKQLINQVDKASPTYENDPFNSVTQELTKNINRQTTDTVESQKKVKQSFAELKKETIKKAQATIATLDAIAPMLNNSTLTAERIKLLNLKKTLSQLNDQNSWLKNAEINQNIDTFKKLQQDFAKTENKRLEILAAIDKTVETTNNKLEQALAEAKQSQQESEVAEEKRGQLEKIVETEETAAKQQNANKKLSDKEKSNQQNKRIKLAKELSTSRLIAQAKKDKATTDNANLKKEIKREAILTKQNIASAVKQFPKKSLLQNIDTIQEMQDLMHKVATSKSTDLTKLESDVAEIKNVKKEQSEIRKQMGKNQNTPKQTESIPALLKEATSPKTTNNVKTEAIKQKAYLETISALLKQEVKQEDQKHYKLKKQLSNNEANVHRKEGDQLQNLNSKMKRLNTYNLKQAEELQKIIHEHKATRTKLAQKLQEARNEEMSKHKATRDDLDDIAKVMKKYSKKASKKKKKISLKP